MALLGVACISAATFGFQLALLRLFAVQQFYHFAFMAVSLALLGFGASGTVLSLRGRPLPPAPLCLAFGVSTLAAYLTINWLPFDSFSIAWDPVQPLYLALYFLATAVPFLFGGLLIGGELMARGATGTSHRVYGANLLGSAFGALLALPALALFGGVGTTLLAATAGTAAGLLFRRPQRGASRTGVLLKGILLAAVGAGLLLMALRPGWLELRISPYKTLPQLEQALGSEHLFTDWSATARIDVLESPTVHVMPGLSFTAPVGPPPQAAVVIDGGTLLPVTLITPDAPEAALLAEYLPIGLAFELRPSADALVLGAGTGLDVLLALGAGAERVTAVEENRKVVEVLTGPFREATGGLYDDPRVEIAVSAARPFSRALDERYGVVVLSLTDPHRPVSSGAYSLTEDYRYTVEGARDYLRALEPGGLLLASRWLQTPPSESARLFATFAQALEQSGRDPTTHLVAFRTLRTMTILAGERPFTDEELTATRTFLRSRGFDPVYLPGLQPDEVNRVNVLPEPVYYELFQDLLANPELTFAAYPFAIEPSTDDHPFFYHHFRWRQTPEVLATLGRTWQPFGGSGFFVVVVLLALVTAAAALFVVLPLVVRRRWERGAAQSSGRVLVYFACLGLAFLFVEVALAQRLILVFGQPVIALAVTLLGLLLFSGLGSLSARRWTLRPALFALVLLLVLLPPALGFVSELALRLPEATRALPILLVLAPLGYLMGLPFPLGLRRVEQRAAALVPWAWAVNGSFSVISAVLAVLLALSWGFSAVLWLGAAAYAGALLAFWLPLRARTS